MKHEGLVAMRTRCNAASPGPWNITRTGAIVVNGDGRKTVAECFSSIENLRYVWALSDAEFIAHARADIPALLDEVTKLTQENERLREEARWIPVAERLPESGVHVLLSCEIRPAARRYVCDGYYAAPKSIPGGCDAECATEYDDEKDEYFLVEGYYEIIKNWDDFSSVVIGDFVTHWRPLPAPPTEVAT